MKRLFTTLLLMIAILIPTGVFGAVSLIDSNSYRIYTIVNNTKYYLNSEGYLVENLNDAYVFTFIKTQVDTTFSSTGWNLGVRFTNPTLTNGSSGNIVNDGHIHTSSWDRNDWERQVFYEKGGLYAIRATNSYSMYWGANTFWDVFSEGNLPEAGYSLQPSFVWRLEDLSSGLTEEPMLAMSDIFIGSDELLTVTIDLYQGNAAVTAFQADIVLPEGLTIQGNPKVVEGTLTNDNGEPSNPSVLYSGGKFVVYNSNGLTFNTDATSIVTLNFKAASDFKGGIITLKNIVFSCDGNNKITTNDVEIIVSNCVLSLSDLSNYKSYMLTNQRATWCSTKSGLSTNQINDINDQMERFAIINNDGQYYIYSVSANAYLRSDKTFGDPQPVSLIQRNYDKYSWFFSFDDSHIINIQSNFQVVINGWNTADDGNLNAIVEVADFDPTIALDRLKSGQQAHLADTLSILYAEVDALLGVIDNTSTYTDVHGIVDEIRSTLTAIVAADYSTFDQISEARLQVKSYLRSFLEKVTIIDDIDITNIVIENSSPTNNIDGWTVTHNPTLDSLNNVAEVRDCYAATISQDIALPAGTYCLLATALTSSGLSAVLFADGERKKIVNVSKSEVNNLEQAGQWFSDGNGLNQLVFHVDKYKNVHIGLQADKAYINNWLAWRNFKLECLAPTYALQWMIEDDEQVVFVDSLKYGDIINPQKEDIYREGYTFKWNDYPATMPANDYIISGSFIPNSYLITYKVDGETIHTDSVVFASELIPIAEPTKEGYTFSGWNGFTNSMPAHDLTINGAFIPNVYTVRYIVDGEEYKIDSVTYASPITLPKEPIREGHTFSGWSEIPQTMPAVDVTITGSFKINTYLVTYMMDGEVWRTDSVTFGQGIPMPEVPARYGYVFNNWTDMPTNGLMPAHDVTVTAYYSPSEIETDDSKYVYSDEAEGYEYVSTVSEESTEVVIPQEVEGIPVTIIPEGAFADQPQVQVVTWENPAPVENTYFAAPEEHGNLLVFVTSDTAIVTYEGNVVRNGIAEKVTLYDGRPMTNPKKFKAEHISITKEFGKETIIGSTSGWETIVVPFDVDSITTEDGQLIAPFGSEALTDKHFWLAKMDATDGFLKVSQIRANVPYIISMPNSEGYIEEYRISGKVTFHGRNVVVQPTADAISNAGPLFGLVPTYQEVAAADSVFVLNDEPYEADGITWPAGSVFVRSSRAARPFEAYTYANASNGGHVKGYIPLDEMATGLQQVQNSECIMHNGAGAIYDLSGRRIAGSGSLKKGLYIESGQKVLVK